MRVLRVLVLLIAGFWIMAAGGMLGGGVDATPTITTSAIGCLVSTAGLGLCLAGLAVGKSKSAMSVAVGLSVFAILYGFFQSLLNLIYQAQAAPTLIYGLYMGAISIAAALFLRRGCLSSATSLRPA
jgi:hypothetical protein